MKAVVLREYGGPEKLKLEEWADPVAGAGQVLVQTAAAGINPIDYKLRSGAMKAFMPLEFPVILGYDFSGVVSAVGPGVTGFAVGDKVFGRAGACYAELIAAGIEGVAKAPANLDLVDAAALAVISNTGEQIISRGAKVQAGQRLVVTGALGYVGRVAVFYAKQAGAAVIAAVRGARAREAALLGADEVLALDDEADMRRLGIVDAVADTVGGQVAESMLGKVRPGGVFATVVGPPENAKLYPTVKVEMVSSAPDPASMLAVAEAVAAGRLALPIGRRVPLSEAASAQAAAENGGIGKVLLLA
ncbi:NADP-dependent oxidoreductase [Edaphobacter bradus]|uniref:NADP-dependent oxidoreductase n=1 Tax=Edaphobacter bradus TaxID=2259016 RepID=UPI0021DFD0CD|nr:NADP-dependent oxidoreductase [Edaphobacter bradus]